MPGCKHVESYINEYLHGTLNSVQFEALEKHILSCKDCHDYYQPQKSSFETFKTLFSINDSKVPFVSSRNEIMNSIAGRCYDNRFINRLYLTIRRNLLGFSMSAAVSLLIVILSITLVGRYGTFVQPSTAGHLRGGNLSEKLLSFKSEEVAGISVISKRILGEATGAEKEKIIEMIRNIHIHTTRENDLGSTPAAVITLKFLNGDFIKALDDPEYGIDLYIKKDGLTVRCFADSKELKDYIDYIMYRASNKGTTPVVPTSINRSTNYGETVPPRPNNNYIAQGQVRNNKVDIEENSLAKLFWNDPVFENFKDTGMTYKEYEKWLFDEAKAKGIDEEKLKKSLDVAAKLKGVYPVVIETGKNKDKDCFIFIFTWGVGSSVKASDTVRPLGHIFIVAIEADTQNVIVKESCR